MQSFPNRGLRTLAAITMAGVLFAGPAAARAGFLPLPASGAQVNDDPASSIDPAQDAGVSDVAGGTVKAGNVQVPWATFEQKVGDSQHIFVRAFKNGAWVTQGAPASLNIDRTVEAEAPSIDFAGAGRTVPWVAWYEPLPDLNWPTNIFASRFDAAANQWRPSGQDRTAGALIPSLNIHVLRTAENPSVAGGAAVAGNDPVPWITWEEDDGIESNDITRRQIFVAKALKQPAADMPCPPGTKPAGHANVNGFCWQQVGLERLDPASPTPLATGDPSLNVDPTRSGVEPDIAFTGPSDTVAWVVWYEEDATAIDGLRSNDMIFAARIVADANADGGFHWRAVGNGTAGQNDVLDTSGTHGFGPCAESEAAEDACTLNALAARNAENPRVAAGTLTPGGTTVPWVVWQEEVAAEKHAVFVSRLVGGDHFELFNAGQPVSNPANDATRPDITFSGNVPYISWQEDVAGEHVTFVGHFEGGTAAPVFRLDTPTGIAASGLNNGDEALRAPISSGCTANPTNADGASCQGGAVGTPFFLYTAGTPGAQSLFAQAFAPTDVTTLPATDIADTVATFNGSANPGGAAVVTHFDFGPTTAYGTSTEDAPLPVGTIPALFADATVTGLPPDSTVHFRAVARTDFVTVPGPDATFDLVNTPPVVTIDDLPDKVRPKDLGTGRVLTVQLTVSEPATVTIEVLRKDKSLRQVVVERTTAGSFEVQISLKRVRGHLTLRATATDADGASTVAEGQFQAK